MATSQSSIDVRGTPLASFSSMKIRTSSHKVSRALSCGAVAWPLGVGLVPTALSPYIKFSITTTRPCHARRPWPLKALEARPFVSPRFRQSPGSSLTFISSKISFKASLPSYHNGRGKRFCILPSLGDGDCRDQRKYSFRGPSTAINCKARCFTNWAEDNPLGGLSDSHSLNRELAAAFKSRSHSSDSSRRRRLAFRLFGSSSSFPFVSVSTAFAFLLFFRGSLDCLLSRSL